MGEMHIKIVDLEKGDAGNNQNRNYNNHQRSNYRNNNYRTGHNNYNNYNNSRRQQNDVMCYNCGELGHISPYCTSERSNNNRNNQRNNRNGNSNRQSNERTLNVFDALSGGENALFRNPSQKTELYPADRKPRRNTRQNPITPNSESQREQKLTRNNNDQSFNDRTRFQKGYDTRQKNNVCKGCNIRGHFKRHCPNISEEERQKITQNRDSTTYLSSAISEGVQDFNLSEHIKSLPCGLTVGQAAKFVPAYGRDLHKMFKRKRMDKKVSYFGKEKQNTMAMKCRGEIEGIKLNVIIDSGAATCVMSSRLMEKLDYEIDRPSTVIAVTADGKRIRSLGEIDVELYLEEEPVKATVQVIESEDETLILGNDWLQKMKTIIDWREKMMSIRNKGEHVDIPVEIMMEDYDSEEYENDSEEYEDED